MRLDGELGLVVLEFRNTTGAVTRSIPSESQLQAYRVTQQRPGGNPSAGSVEPPAAGPADPFQPGVNAV